MLDEKAGDKQTPKDDGKGGGEMDIRSIVDLHAKGVRSPHLMRAINALTDRTLAGLSLNPPGYGSRGGSDDDDPCGRCVSAFRLTHKEVAASLDRLEITHVHANAVEPSIMDDDHKHVFLFHLEDPAYVRRVGERIGLDETMVTAMLDRPVVIYDLVLVLDDDGDPVTLYMTTESPLLDDMFLRGAVQMNLGRIMSIAMDWNSRHVSPAVTVTTPEGILTVGTRWGCSVKRGVTREAIDDQIEWALETSTSFWRSKMFALVGAEPKL